MREHTTNKNKTGLLRLLVISATLFIPCLTPSPASAQNVYVLDPIKDPFNYVKTVQEIISYTRGQNTQGIGLRLPNADGTFENYFVQQYLGSGGSSDTFKVRRLNPSNSAMDPPSKLKVHAWRHFSTQTPLRERLERQVNAETQMRELRDWLRNLGHEDRAHPIIRSNKGVYMEMPLYEMNGADFLKSYDPSIDLDRRRAASFMELNSILAKYNFIGDIRPANVGFIGTVAYLVDAGFPGEEHLFAAFAQYKNNLSVMAVGALYMEISLGSTIEQPEFAATMPLDELERQISINYRNPHAGKLFKQAELLVQQSPARAKLPLLLGKGPTPNSGGNAYCGVNPSTRMGKMMGVMGIAQTFISILANKEEYLRSYLKASPGAVCSKWTHLDHTLSCDREYLKFSSKGGSKGIIKCMYVDKVWENDRAEMYQGKMEKACTFAYYNFLIDLRTDGEWVDYDLIKKQRPKIKTYEEAKSLLKRQFSRIVEEEPRQIYPAGDPDLS